MDRHEHESEDRGLALEARGWTGWTNPQLFLPSSEPLHLGDHVVARVRRGAPGGVDPAGVNVSAELVVFERVKPPDGPQRTEEVYRSSAEALVVDQVNGAIEADIGIDIPLADAPPSLDLPHNEVVWELIVHMAAAGREDDLSTFPMEVAPQVAERLQSGGSGR